VADAYLNTKAKTENYNDTCILTYRDVLAHDKV